MICLPYKRLCCHLSLFLTCIYIQSYPHSPFLIIICTYLHRDLERKKKGQENQQYMANQSTMEKCIACGQTGHSTTACNNGKVGSLNLFGVQIHPKPDQSNGKEKVDEDVERHPPVASNIGSLLRKSKSMEILNIYDESGSPERGYQSDDQHVRSQNRKKGTFLLFMKV